MSTQGSESIFSSNQLESQKDRRQYPRIHVHWYCFIDAPNDTGAAPARIRVIEISEVGFGFVCDVAYPIGSTIKFRMNIPDPVNGSQWHLAPGQAEIVNSVLSREGFRSGVSIKSMLIAHQDMLKAWVKLRLR